ncbi:flagellar biosynthesis protein FlhF [Lentibacillus salicampi]|uniref:Flagellar biosynthesis protein FlhF n=1 Tax=Lentibacillus salicampi TaxID=175306 RepID=A0A4Y9AH51_9BACI|nr:flagellar biosynthesis protein FlhF [Lentibacillus salicampi]TFJ94682.1 flagellar biosynthesis protein FlhF [Lentibacillus salicampi]
MKVKKYVAPTMPEAMNKIRKELGSDAVILNSKEIDKGGFLGLFKKRHIEVVAALDPQPNPERKQDAAKRPPITRNPKTADDSVINEIRQLKKMVELQAGNDRDYSAGYQVVYDYLINQEIDGSLAKEIMDNVVGKHAEQDTESLGQETILQDVGHEIEKRLSAHRFSGVSIDKKLVQFVGPTGVGKTTTIAKVAASSMLKENKRVALITADTYRIAAIEQLKTYANILNVPLEVVYDLNDYQAAVEKFASYDLVLVDTAGRNYRDEKYVKELQKTLPFNAEIGTCLVLSLTARNHDIMEIYEQFQHLPVDDVIFTKADETGQYGSILNIALIKQTSIAFITNGQDVPDDIVELSSKHIANLLTGGCYDV